MSVDSTLSSYRLVLVGPMYAGNIGACARVAANFGVQDTWVVAAQCRWKDSREAMLSAVGPAADLLSRFREAGSLVDALKDCELAVGFSRRTGEQREPDLLVREIPVVASKKTALVFGREDGGLSREELSLCARICKFSTSELMPSLNLSHAVAVVLSRLYEDHAQSSPVSNPTESCSIELFEALLEHWQEAMRDAGLSTGGNPGRLLSPIRKLLQRAQITEREVGILRAYLSKTQIAMGRRKNGIKPPG